MKRLFGIILAISLLLCAMAPAMAEETFKAHVLAIWNEDEAGSKVVKILSEQFKETHPGFDYEIEFIVQNDLDQKLSVLAASAEIPDLFISGTSAITESMYRQGLTVTVDQFFADTGISACMPQSVYDGMKNLQFNPETEHLLALPTEANVEGYWYNKEIFAENGLEVPTTWEEFDNVVKTLMDNGVQPFAVSGDSKWPLTRMAATYINSKLGPTGLDSAMKGETSWTSEAFIDAYTWLQNLGTSGAMGISPNTIDYDTAIQMFLSGKAAMHYMGSWISRDLINEDVNMIGDVVGFFGAPTFEDGVGEQNQYIQNYGTVWVIGAQNYENELCREWLAHIFSNYGDVALTENGAITGYTTSEGLEIPAYVQMVLDLFETAGTPTLWHEARLGTEATDASQNNVQLLISGDMTPEEYGAALNEAVGFAG